MNGSPSAIVTMGLGSWGDPSLLVTGGYGIGEEPPIIVVVDDSSVPLRRRRRELAKPEFPSETITVHGESVLPEILVRLTTVEFAATAWPLSVVGSSEMAGLSVAGVVSTVDRLAELRALDEEWLEGMMGART